MIKSSKIENKKANIAARTARHAKLLSDASPSLLERFLPWLTGALFIDLLSHHMEQLFKIKSEDSLLRRFSNRISMVTLAFLIFSTLIPVYYEDAEGDLLAELSFDDAMQAEGSAGDFTLAQSMTADGFLLKPAISSAESDRSVFGEIFVYTVKPGDTLSTIASRFRLQKETLMWENDLYNAHRLRVGEKLKVLPVDGVSHPVKKGETLDKIAKKYQVDAAKITKQNQLTGDALAVDTTLIIPGAKKEIPRYIASRAYPSSAPASATGLRYDGPPATGLIWPTQGKLTQAFHRGHYAIDIGNRSHGPIYAAASGTVIKAATGWNGGYGNMIIIDHGNGMETLYAHLEKLYVTAGQTVSQGDTIGWMGRTGRVYGPTGIHLHFEVRVNGVKYNPMVYF